MITNQTYHPSPSEHEEHLGNVAEAFSRKSRVYDLFGEDHVNLTRMRRKVYEHISRHLPTGEYLLELNAGTGLDAVEMVRRGYRVHATDLSSGMIAEIKRKVDLYDIQDQLTVQQCSFTELGQVNEGPFDGVYSNLGGLNCISDLSLVTRHLPQLLRPGGIVTCVVMPPVCLWELAHFYRDWRTSTRRLRKGGVSASVEGVRFVTHYYSAGQVMRAFGPGFRKLALEGLSVITPTADNKSFALRFRRLFRWLTFLDDRISHWFPFREWGDFYILSLIYEG